MRISLIAYIFFCVCLNVAYSQMNSPYPASEKNEAIYYSSFTQRPKFLDPVKSYSSDEYRFIGNIYEPIVQYQYFYTLILFRLNILRKFELIILFYLFVIYLLLLLYKQLYILSMIGHRFILNIQQPPNLCTIIKFRQR